MNDWSTYCQRNGVAEVLGYEQHGDLNPRNILITGDNAARSTIRLIDFARFGVWPSYMDIARLQAQLSLRLLDPPGSMREMFPDRIAVWDDTYWTRSAPSWIKKSQPSDFISIGVYAMAMKELEAVISSAIAIKSSDLGSASGRHLGLMRANEFLRIVCYPDTSWPKRIWFALLAEKTLSREPALPDS